MAEPTVVVVAVADEGHFFLRFTDSGDFAGDTWHPNLEDALHQAKFEYGERNGSWTPRADGITDSTDFSEVVAQLTDPSSDE